jgi:hypothetical protein
MKSIYKITLLLLLLPSIALPNNDKKKHEKSKVIKREFDVNANAEVSLNNKFGNLNISTWDKNLVEIKVTITVKGDDINTVEDKLSSIQINFNTNSSLVEVATTFNDKKNSWSWWGKNKNINYKINYDVKMPKTNSVDLNNDYGNIYLDNLKGPASINCDYGKISIGELSAKNNSINLDYCSASSINYMRSGNVNINYSKITIDKSEKIKVNAEYSTLKFEKTENLNFNCDYGSISVNEATHIDGNSDCVSMRFGTVKKNLTIDTEYGGITIKNLAKGFENVTINGQYSGIKIGIAPNTAFNFEIDLQNAGFKRNENNIAFFKSISKSNKKYYAGKYGQGKSNSSINIKSQFGSVTLKAKD